MKTKICAIVPARNVERSITNTLRQLNRAKIHGAIIVCNGCTDATTDKILTVKSMLSIPIHILNIKPSLGHDVPRAYGAAYSLKHKAFYSDFLFVDSDWNGSFGPMLESFIEDFKQEKLDIMWSAKPQNIDQSRHYTAPWVEAVKHFPHSVVNSDPGIVPFIVSRQTFCRISPYWLHHPGKWFAYSISVGKDVLTIGSNPHWDRKLTGHMTQGTKHDKMMWETLLGDAAEGACILTNKPLSRLWQGKPQIGYHKARRTDLLQNWLGTFVHKS